MKKSRRRPLQRFLTAFLGLSWITGCAMLSGIPGLDTPDGRVYAKRCGGCHGVPDPRFRTMPEWQEVLPKMDRLIRDQGLLPVSQQEREAINRYLSHHAKS